MKKPNANHPTRTLRTLDDRDLAHVTGGDICEKGDDFTTCVGKIYAWLGGDVTDDTADSGSAGAPRA